MRRNGFVNIVHIRRAVARGVRNLLAYESRRQTPEISTQRVDVGVSSALFKICSGSLRDLELEAEAVHETTTVFPLLFLLGRAR